MPDAMTTPLQMRADVVERADEGSNVFRFRASSSIQARDGLSIPAGAWDYEHFLRNPVVLLGHGWGPAGAMPIGHVSDLTRDDLGLLATVSFDPEDEHAQTVMRKLRRGDLNAVSVGYLIHEAIGPDGKPLDLDAYWRLPKGSVATRVELLELSVVAVPADPLAVALRSAGVLDLDSLADAIARRIAPGGVADGDVPARGQDEPLQPERLDSLADAIAERLSAAHERVPVHIHLDGELIAEAVAAAVERHLATPDHNDSTPEESPDEAHAASDPLARLLAAVERRTLSAAVEPATDDEPADDVLDISSLGPALRGLISNE